MAYKNNGVTIISDNGNVTANCAIFTANAREFVGVTGAVLPSSDFQGSVSGYTSGGFAGPPLPSSDTIDKHPFSNDANATDVGNLTYSIRSASGQSSLTHGYVSAGSSLTAGRDRKSVV